MSLHQLSSVWSRSRVTRMRCLKDLGSLGNIPNQFDVSEGSVRCIGYCLLQHWMKARELTLDSKHVSTAICNIPAQNHIADLVRETNLVFWDDALMQDRHIFEVMERTFRDLRNDTRGVVFFFHGEVRQILLVVPREIRAKFYRHTSNVLHSDSTFNFTTHHQYA